MKTVSRLMLCVFAAAAHGQITPPGDPIYRDLAASGYPLEIQTAEGHIAYFPGGVHYVNRRDWIGLGGYRGRPYPPPIPLFSDPQDFYPQEPCPQPCLTEQQINRIRRRRIRAEKKLLQMQMIRYHREIFRYNAERRRTRSYRRRRRFYRRY